MSLNAPSGRPLACLKLAVRLARQPKQQTRSVSAGYLRYRAGPPAPPRDDPWAPVEPRRRHVIKRFGALPGIKKTCAEPLKTFNASQLALLDPSGARTRLFSTENPDSVKLGDVLLVRFKNGDPFHGICMSVRRRGPDTGILLRNTVMRVGTEMWIKIYNPTVAGIEIVQRAERKARRARLTYLRKPKHDRGDLSNVLNEYLKTRRTLGASKKEKKDKLAAKKATAAKVAETVQTVKTPNQQAKSKGKAAGR